MKMRQDAQDFEAAKQQKLLTPLTPLTGASAKTDTAQGLWRCAA